MFGLNASESLSHPVKIGASVIVEKDSWATPVSPPSTLLAGVRTTTTLMLLALFQVSSVR